MILSKEVEIYFQYGSYSLRDRTRFLEIDIVGLKERDG